MNQFIWEVWIMHLSSKFTMHFLIAENPMHIFGNKYYCIYKINYQQCMFHLLSRKQKDKHKITDVVGTVVMTFDLSRLLWHYSLKSRGHVVSWNIFEI